MNQRAVIDLAVGDPAGAPPELLVEAVRHGLLHPSSSHYTPTAGLEPTRHAIATYYSREHSVAVDIDDVIITHGARPAIFFGLLAADRPLRPAGYFAPGYTAFKPLIVNSGMIPVPVQLPNEHLSLANLEDQLRPLAGGVLISNTPHNPSGRIFDRSELQLISCTARTHDILIVSDLVYADLYEGERPSSLLSIDRGAIEIISMSKSFRACGWRVGAVVGEAGWLRRVARRHEAMNGVPYAFQSAAEIAWTQMPEVESFRDQLAVRRRALVEGLRTLGFSIDTKTNNRSGMFVWAEVPSSFFRASDVKGRLDRVGVLVSDGADFEGNSDRYLRFALNVSPDVLGDAVARIGQALEPSHG